MRTDIELVTVELFTEVVEGGKEGFEVGLEKDLGFEEETLEGLGGLVEFEDRVDEKGDRGGRGEGWGEGQGVGGGGEGQG